MLKGSPPRPLEADSVVEWPLVAAGGAEVVMGAMVPRRVAAVSRAVVDLIRVC